MDAEERYLTRILLKQSGRQHVKLKSDIHNDYTTGDDRYPKTRKNHLHLLTQYTKPTITINSESQGNSFSQRTRDGRNPKNMTRSIRKINSATIVTKNVMHLVVVPRIIIKSRTMTTRKNTV